jgi:hypothetical protein
LRQAVTSVGQYVSAKSSRPCADGRQLSALEQSDDGKHRQHKAMTASRPFADGRHFSASERIDDGKHFTAPNGGKHFTALSREAFHSPCGRSISRPLRGKHRPIVGISIAYGERHFTALAGEASAYCWLFEQICFFGVFVWLRLCLCLCFLFLFCVCVCVCVCGCVCAGHA